jgi:DNA replication initiation complex subunit (GINS family)
MDPEKEYIPVTVDKSHIITIGERLYTESIEFIREIALMKDSKNPRQAFERQSRLLKDAFIEKERID